MGEWLVPSLFFIWRALGYTLAIFIIILSFYSKSKGCAITLVVFAIILVIIIALFPWEVSPPWKKFNSLRSTQAG